MRAYMNTSSLKKNNLLEKSYCGQKKNKTKYSKDENNENTFKSKYTQTRNSLHPLIVWDLSEDRA